MCLVLHAILLLIYIIVIFIVVWIKLSLSAMYNRHIKLLREGCRQSILQCLCQLIVRLLYSRYNINGNFQRCPHFREIQCCRFCKKKYVHLKIFCPLINFLPNGLLILKIKNNNIKFSWKQ